MAGATAGAAPTLPTLTTPALLEPDSGVARVAGAQGDHLGFSVLTTGPSRGTSAGDNIRGTSIFLLLLICTFQMFY